MTAIVCVQRSFGPFLPEPFLLPTPRPKDDFAKMLMKVRSKYLGIPRDVLL